MYENGPLEIHLGPHTQLLLSPVKSHHVSWFNRLYDAIVQNRSWSIVRNNDFGLLPVYSRFIILLCAYVIIGLILLTSWLYRSYGPWSRRYVFRNLPQLHKTG
jgi:hypothetical protein